MISGDFSPISSRRCSRLTLRRKISFSQGMAAKKQMTPMPTTGKTASEETTGKMATKKRAKKKTNGPTKAPAAATLPIHENIDPLVLADLAIKISHFKSVTGSAAAGIQPFRWDDAGLHESLDDARRFLLAAKGAIDEEVHAYRLFSEDEEPMSYDKIAQHFEHCGWKLMTSRNKVESVILDLVASAEKEIQKEREKYLELVAVRHRYAGGVYGLVDQMRERIRAMIDHFALEVLFSDPDKIADVMGQVFLRLMGEDISDGWEQHLDEEFATGAGFHSFMKYVCDGLTYEQFIGTGKNVMMDPERLACLNHFLERADAWAASEYRAKARDLDTLMRLVRGRNEVPDSMVSNLEHCLAELRKTPPREETVKQLAKSAREGLTKFCERNYLVRVVKAQECGKLIFELGSRSGVLSPSEQFPEEKIEHLRKLLQHAVESVQNPDLEPMEIRATLNELRGKLADPSLLKAANVDATRFSGSIATEMSRVAEGLERGLQKERVSLSDAEQSLEKLLSDLKPHKGTRKCRPYELFLFAAQNKLWREKLIRKRSLLVPGVVTGPPHSGSLSILMSHRGAEIAMGIQEPR